MPTGRDYRRLVVCADCGKQQRTCARPTRERCLSCAAKRRVQAAPPTARFRALPPAWKARALLLHARGYGCRTVVRAMADEGIVLKESTVQSWLYGNGRIAT